MSNAASVTRSGFDAAIAQGLVLVDFWAPWCGPCKVIGPVLDELAAELSGRVRIVKVNVDEEGELAERFGIQSIPTLLLFKDGKPAGKQVGATAKDHLRRFIESAA